jgi:hypothetical protein
MKPSPREIVLDALAQGKERSAAYSRKEEGDIVVYGTVAVIKEGESYSVGWHEIRSNTHSVDEPDTEGTETFPTADHVEAFIVAKFRLSLEALAPSKGIRFF